MRFLRFVMRFVTVTEVVPESCWADRPDGLADRFGEGELSGGAGSAVGRLLVCAVLVQTVLGGDRWLDWLRGRWRDPRDGDGGDAWRFGWRSGWR